MFVVPVNGWWCLSEVKLQEHRGMYCKWKSVKENNEKNIRSVNVFVPRRLAEGKISMIK